MDDLPDLSLSDEQSAFLTKVKTSALRTAEDYRIQIRRAVSQEGVQNFFDNEKMTALGFAGGAIAGAML